MLLQLPIRGNNSFVFYHFKLREETANTSGKKKDPSNSPGILHYGPRMSRDLKPDAKTIEQGRNKYPSHDKEDA